MKNSSAEAITDWADDNDTMDAVDFFQIDNSIQRIGLPIICVCGIFGIIVTIIVLSRKNMHTSTNAYLIALSVADLLFLLLFAILQAEELLEFDSVSHYKFLIYSVYSKILMSAFLMASIWLTVMLAVERYIAICQPFRTGKFDRVEYARIIILAIFVLSFLSRLPNFWEYQIITVYDPTTNTSFVYPENTEFSFNSNYLTIYPWLVDGILTSILPFILLLSLNVILIWEVRRSTRYLRRSLMVAATSTVRKEELQVTFMLIGIVLVFFICQAPYVIYTAIFSIKKEVVISTQIITFQHVVQLMLALKSAVNFTVYCWFSEKFWLTLKRMVCSKVCLQMESDTKRNTSSIDSKRSSNYATKDTII